MELTWKKASGASGYQIQASTKKSFKGAKKKTVKKNQYKVSKLKPGKKSYVRVRAYQTYRSQNGKTAKAYGAWTVTSIKVSKSV